MDVFVRGNAGIARRMKLQAGRRNVCRKHNVTKLIKRIKMLTKLAWDPSVECEVAIAERRNALTH